MEKREFWLVTLVKLDMLGRIVESDIDNIVIVTSKGRC